MRFRLGIEARRIDVAFAYDMAAVAVSNIQPLPHQLEAVYDCFLKEPRLRFLLADDPGAGKTIMAGLYMKELILRRAGDRILVVTPANLRPQWVRELSERFQLDFVQLGAAQFDAALTENPWDQHDRVVVSRDFLRTDRAREAFDAAGRDWDLAVIDEAHGFTLSVDGKGAIRDRSERYRAAEAVGRKGWHQIAQIRNKELRGVRDDQKEREEARTDAEAGSHQARYDVMTVHAEHVPGDDVLKLVRSVMGQLNEPGISVRVVLSVRAEGAIAGDVGALIQEGVQQLGLQEVRIEFR